MARKSTKTEEVVEELTTVAPEEVVAENSDEGETLTEVVENLAETVGETLETLNENAEEKVEEEQEVHEVPSTDEVPECSKVKTPEVKSTTPNQIFTPSDIVVRNLTVKSTWIG